MNPQLTKKKTMARIVVLTGAGISAESGIQTFRDAGGLWEGYKVEDVATPEAWQRQPKVVQRFYNDRRKQLLDVSPNAAHIALASIQDQHDVIVITQNVDDLHERAGSKQVIHLHGELLKARSTSDDSLIYPWKEDILDTDRCDRGSQLRPHIVWFGEMVPMLEPAIVEIQEAEIVLVIGSSMQVYPAASLVAFAPQHIDIYYIDPNPRLNHELSIRKNLHVIEMKATDGVAHVLKKLL